MSPRGSDYFFLMNHVYHQYNSIYHHASIQMLEKCDVYIRNTTLIHEYVIATVNKYRYAVNVYTQVAAGERRQTNRYLHGCPPSETRPGLQNLGFWVIFEHP